MKMNGIITQATILPATPDELADIRNFTFQMQAKGTEQQFRQIVAAALQKQPVEIGAWDGVRGLYGVTVTLTFGEHSIEPAQPKKIKLVRRKMDGKTFIVHYDVNRPTIEDEYGLLYLDQGDNMSLYEVVEYA